MRELILYVHVPFCSSKCHFCGWVAPITPSELVKRQELYDQYVAGVVRQIDLAADTFSDSRSARLIYFGGGTPSLLSAGQLETLLTAVSKRFSLSERFDDITIEASPESVDSDKCRQLRSAGFSRLSLGVQSFSDERLRRVGRAHDSEGAVRAFRAARSAKFGNVNIDLILGLPDQTASEWSSTIEKAISLGPEHLSVYIYRKIPGTVSSQQLASNHAQVLEAPEVERLYQMTCELLEKAGYEEYMFQMFCKEQKKCFADFRYFHIEHDYLGFGAGAHSMLETRVFGHSANLTEYLNNPVTPSFTQRARDVPEFLSAKLFEMLHTDSGVDFSKFENRLGLSLQEARTLYPGVRKVIDQLQVSRHVEEFPTGFRFVDARHRAVWLCHA